MTLGVRVIAVGENETVLLVKHTYVPGWHLPGGGVERGETARQSAEKELLEEAGIGANGGLEPLSVFANHRASKRDHVVLFLCRNWQKVHEFTPNREIAEIGFFPVDALPPETTGPTRSRIEEALGSRRFPEFW